jgi:hypothetical protein
LKRIPRSFARAAAAIFSALFFGRFFRNASASKKSGWSLGRYLRG